MTYTIENIYTEETKGFIHEYQAYIYLKKEIEKLNNKCGDNSWSIEDFRLFKFDPYNCRYCEVKIQKDKFLLYNL